jgi:transposase
MNSDGVILKDVFSFSNSSKGFSEFTEILFGFSETLNDVKVGLEATGHYSDNLLKFLKDSNLDITIFNPLSTNFYRKASTLRKTKTDKVDAVFIAQMLLSNMPSTYSYSSELVENVKSLSRHRFRLVGYKSKLKISFTRLLDITFPELSTNVWSVHQSSSYSLLLALPSPTEVAKCHLTKLTNLLKSSSKGKYGKAKALELKELAKNSIGVSDAAKAFELQQTIRLIQGVEKEIKLLDSKIKEILDKLKTPLMTIPGISYTLAAIILSEIRSIHNFSTPGKLLAFSGLEPSTHQSGKYTSPHARMVKRGSKYLRWALLTAARLVSMRAPVFNEYLAKKRSEGKHYLVALTHSARKLIRVIYYLLKTEKQFVN